MAKKQQFGTGKTQTATTALSVWDKIPEKQRDRLAIGFIILSLLVLLAPAIFTDGTYLSGDMTAYWSYRPYETEQLAKSEPPLWIPHMFSGMPFHGALLRFERWWDFTGYAFMEFTRFFGQITNDEITRIAVYYMFFGVGMYLFMRLRRFDRFVSLFTSLAAVFSTSIILWLYIGHHSKPISLLAVPFMLAFMELLKKRFSWLYFGLLVFATHIFGDSMHVQVIVYSLIILSGYCIAELWEHWSNSPMRNAVLRNIGLLAVAGALAFAMSGDRFLSTLEYNKHSIRGSLPIEKAIEETGKDKSEGLDYDYATNWSFSPEEVATFFVPNYFGFGKLEYSGPLTREPIQVPTYWGQMPFTDAANYMGIAVLGLALLGIWNNRKDKLVISLTALSVLALFYSFGRNFPLVYDIFYYYVPAFNKFRAPSLMLYVMQFCMPILAAYGLRDIVQWSKESTPAQRKQLLGWTAAFIGMLVLGFVYSAIWSETYIASVAASPAGKQLPEQLHTFVYDSMISDWYITALIGIAFFGAAYAFVSGKMNFTIFSALAVILLLGDLWRVDSRIPELSEANIEVTQFPKTDVIRFLKEDTSLWRLADFNKMDNHYSHFGISSVHGYHAAKLRVYQDLLDVAGNANGGAVYNPFLWNLMGVKYIIAKGQPAEGVTPVFQSSEVPETYIFRNDAVLPRAFFVDTVKVQSGIKILESLRDGNFNPRSVAFVEEKLPVDVQPAGATAKAEITSYSSHKISIATETEGTNSLLFLSEIYYQPGWKAYIDGKEIPVVKTNYAFRGVIVPKGKHTVEMRFESAAFNLGKNLSIGTNIFAIALLAFGFYSERKKLSKQEQQEA